MRATNPNPTKTTNTTINKVKVHRKKSCWGEIVFPREVPYTEGMAVVALGRKQHIKPKPMEKKPPNP